MKTLLEIKEEFAKANNYDSFSELFNSVKDDPYELATMFENLMRVQQDEARGYVCLHLGYIMQNFNVRLPDKERDIMFLLGNGITGIDSCRLVRGRFHEDYPGDFSRDENGKFIYVTYWRYI